MKLPRGGNISGHISRGDLRRRRSVSPACFLLGSNHAFPGHVGGGEHGPRSVRTRGTLTTGYLRKVVEVSIGRTED